MNTIKKNYQDTVFTKLFGPYLSGLYFSHSELKTKLYSTSKIELPSPELYVIYTGERGDKPVSLSLKESFFPLSNLDLRVDIIYSDNERWEVLDMGMLLLSQEEITESYGDFREMQGRSEGLSEGSRSHAITVYRNCIERGMNREEAIAISGIDETDIPQE